MLRSYATADDTFADGFQFRLSVGIDNPSENHLRMRFNDWTSSTTGSIHADNNMQISMAANGSNAVSVGNAYPTNSLVSTATPTSTGITQDVYIFLKVPPSTAGGAYSTTFGLRSDIN